MFYSHPAHKIRRTMRMKMMIINDDRGDVEQYQKADMTMLCFMALGAKYHSPQIMQPTFSCQAAA